jgi:hypothetical protein
MLKRTRRPRISEVAQARPLMGIPRAFNDIWWLWSISFRLVSSEDNYSTGRLVTYDDYDSSLSRKGNYYMARVSHTQLLQSLLQVLLFFGKVPSQLSYLFWFVKLHRFLLFFRRITRSKYLYACESYKQMDLVTYPSSIHGHASSEDKLDHQHGIFYVDHQVDRHVLSDCVFQRHSNMACYTIILINLIHTFIDWCLYLSTCP